MGKAAILTVVKGPGTGAGVGSADLVLYWDTRSQAVQEEETRSPGGLKQGSRNL